MPLSAPAPFSSSFPALYLYPLNESFVPKHISLLHNQRVKIGRQTNAKTAPGERNGFFDSKVLSRQHAEVWEESSKIYIKDVKSSNGTFINGERLSAEGLESEPFELKSDDIVEFGIDIVGEDNKTIIHHKVAARVLCILSEQDAQMAARTEQLQMQQHLHQQFPPSSNMSPQGPPSMMNQAGPSNVSGPSNSSFGFPNQQQRRPMSHQGGISGMGGMGGSMRPPGKSGLTFDHILTRLQGELQKSRDTTSELHSVTGAMNEIHETLGGGLPPNVPPYSQPLPPVRLLSHPQQQPSGPTDEQQQQQYTGSSAGAAAPDAPLLSELQSQLAETQNSLAQHVDKIRALETALKEQDTIRNEVRLLREMMDAVRRRDFPESNKKGRMSDRRLNGDLLDDVDSDDDSMSIGTVLPHELERVDEEDEEQVLNANSEDEPHPNAIQDNEERDEEREENDQRRAEQYEREEDDEDRRRRREELGRPHTPEPTNLGMRDSGDIYEPRKRSKTLLAARSPLGNGISHSVVDELTARMTSLSSQLESALELSSNLQTQHATAQSTISTLEGKVESLENLVKMTLAQQQNGPSRPAPVSLEPASSSQFESLTAMVNDWKKSVEGQWTGVQEEWTQERERLSRAREEWEAKSRTMDSGLEKLERLQRSVNSNHFFHGNGDVVRDLGLATPPSPRSLSADSQKPRRRRGRSASKRRGSSSDRSNQFDTTEERSDDLSASAKISRGDGKPFSWLPTPAPTYDGSSVVSSPTNDTNSHSKFGPPNNQLLHPTNLQTTVGVIMLSVAAAAVIWRVKPE